MIVIRSPSFIKSASWSVWFPLSLTTLTLIGTYTAAVDVARTLSYTTAPDSENFLEWYAAVIVAAPALLPYTVGLVVPDIFCKYVSPPELGFKNFTTS